MVLKKLCLKQVVEPYAGARYFGEPYKVPKSDHFSIAKPEDRGAIQHRLLCLFIENISNLPTVKNQKRTVLNQFATKLQEHAYWDDLVVPQNVYDGLKQIAFELEGQLLPVQQNVPSAAWKTGTQVLFHGDRGTGKTLAARILATELRTDLYRINYGAVLNQHPIETLSHLHHLLEEVTEKNAILLIDNAEILFGLQASVKKGDSQNSPTTVSSLMGALELCGNLIFATTMKSELDERLFSLVSHIIEFPFPDATLRRFIWQRSIPRDLENRVFEFDPEILGQQYKLCGEDIQNAVRTAMGMATREGYDYPQMGHLESAAAKFLTDK